MEDNRVVLYTTDVQISTVIADVYWTREKRHDGKGAEGRGTRWLKFRPTRTHKRRPGWTKSSKEAYTRDDFFIGANTTVTGRFIEMTIAVVPFSKSAAENHPSKARGDFRDFRFNRFVVAGGTGSVKRRRRRRSGKREKYTRRRNGRSIRKRHPCTSRVLI